MKDRLQAPEEPLKNVIESKNAQIKKKKPFPDGDKGELEAISVKMRREVLVWNIPGPGKEDIESLWIKTEQAAVTRLQQGMVIEDRGGEAWEQIMNVKSGGRGSWLMAPPHTQFWHKLSAVRRPVTHC